jgi:hypothetical protein
MMVLVLVLPVMMTTTVQEVYLALRKAGIASLKVERFVGQGGARQHADDDGGEGGGLRGQTQAEQADVMKKFRR